MNLLNLFSEVNMKDVLQFLPDAVFVVDESNGEILWVNDRAAIIFESSKEDLKGANFDELVVKGMELAEQSSYKDVSVIGGAVANSKEFFVELRWKIWYLFIYVGIIYACLCLLRY